MADNNSNLVVEKELKKIKKYLILILASITTFLIVFITIALVVIFNFIYV